MVPALHIDRLVRSTVFVTALVIVAAWVALHRLEPTANADVAVNQPIARMQEVRSIALDGKNLAQARLREVLETRPGEQLDTPRLERDRAAMERALAELGYLAAHVEPAIVTFDGSGAAYITFEVDQGRLFHLRSVEVIGPNKDLAVITISPGDDAIRHRIDGARQALSEGLARRGKRSAVELSVRTDMSAAAVDVKLTTR